MSITAKDLSKSGAHGKELDTIIQEQLHMIDDKLIQAKSTWGKNVIVHNLPTIFVISGLDKQNAQRIVYSSILLSLKKRKFDPKLLLEENKSTLYISWVTQFDEEEIKAMNQLINSALIIK